MCKFSERFFKLKPLIFLFFVLFNGASVAESKEYSAKEIYKNFSDKVCSIIVHDEDGREVANGTGFVYGSDINILTNRHVVAGGSGAVVECGERRAIVKGYVADIEGLDLVVLEADSPLGEPLVKIDYSSNKPEIGAEIYAIGNPLGYTKSIVTGVVSAIRFDGNEKTEYLQISAPINPGNSGGPIFDTNGNVVGVATLKRSDAEGIGFAISIDQVKRLLKRELSKISTIEGESRRVEVQQPKLNFDGDIVSFRGVDLGQPCGRLIETNASSDEGSIIREIRYDRKKLAVWHDAELSHSEIRSLDELIQTGQGVAFVKGALLGEEVSIMVQCMGGYFSKAAYVIADEGVFYRAKNALISKYGLFIRVQKFGIEAVHAGESVISLQMISHRLSEVYVITYSDARVSEVAAKKMRVLDLIRVGRDNEL